MALQSQLLGGDALLEAAAVSDLAHIVPGARGEHVRKIQLALIQLDGAPIDADGSYGPATAAAVLAYKQKRNIINFSYQSQADNIVGKMTLASLDKELAQEAGEPLEITVQGDKPRFNQVVSQRRAFLQLAFGFNPGLLDVAAPNPQFVMKFTRWSPRVIGTIRCAQTAGNPIAVCTNEPDIAQDPTPSAVRVAFLSDIDSPSNQGANLAPEDGGKVSLTKDLHVMRFETFRPGDATITVSRPDVVRILSVEVRQDRKGPVLRPPLTKLSQNPKSAFFSASKAEGGEEDPHNVFTGRPVNVNLGGRLINLGGEIETPQFEDYQVDLNHSLGQLGGFRPWADDPDPTVFIPSKSASHITMRGTPLFDSFIKVIKRIAQPGCFFTYSGQTNFLAKFRSEIPGRDLEAPIPNGTGRDGSPFTFFAYQIT
jgi:hypothetical protein